MAKLATSSIGACLVALAWASLPLMACDAFEARSGDLICVNQSDCTGDRVCSMGYCVVAGSNIDGGQDDGGTPDAPMGAPDAGPAFASAPRPAIQLTPAAGVPSTVFTAGAGATIDLEDAVGTLTFSWDWESDGTFDDTGVSATHSYATPGSYDIALRVEDPGGLRGFKSFRVIVAANADLITVTTGTDESDGGATPASPGGAGLSLREAIDYTNATAGRQLIVVPPGTTTMIGSQLPALDDAVGVDLVGDGAAVDGTNGTGSACLVTGGDDNVILGLELRNCKGDAFRDANGSANNVISRCSFHDNPSGVRASGDNLIVGPDNEFDSHAGIAVDLAGFTTVIGNLVHNSAGPGVFIASPAQTSVIIGNHIYANESGVSISTSVTGAVLQNNTLDGNGTGVLAAASNVTMVDLRNNIISNSTGVGLMATDDNFVQSDNNDFFGNSTADCSGCSGLGSNSSTLNPQYIDRASGDFRLRPTSSLIDAALDLGNDLNGPETGNFNGGAPDMGASESP
jgi:PKD repeat protein